MKQVDKISVAELQQMAENMYGGLVKAVVDIKKRVVVVDAELHADEEQYLLEQGSVQGDLWGINLYPAKFGAVDFIEFDSMINIRPRANNMSRGVEDVKLQDEIKSIVNEVVREQ